MTLDEWTDSQGDLRGEIEGPMDFIDISDEDKEFLSRMIRTFIRERYGKRSKIRGMTSSMVIIDDPMIR